MFKKLLPYVLILFLASVLFYEAWFDTPTYDEPANMAASFDYVLRNDFRIYPDNPPLVKLLAGLALLPVRSKLNFPDNLSSYQNPQKFDLYAFGTDFLYRSGNDPKLIAFLTRIPNILFTLALGVLIYYFAMDLYGKNAGLLALFLYSFDPNIRGHGHILAFDIPLAFVITLILYLTHKLFITISKIKDKKSKTQIRYKKYILAVSLLFALGFLTKFTFGFFALVYLFGVLLPGDKLRFTIKDGAIFIISILLTSFTLLWIFGILTNYNKKTLDYDKVPIIESANTELGSDFKWNLIKFLPVPYHYKVGMQIMYTHNLVSQPAYLLGEVRARNNWFFYFPISFLLKVPVPTLFFIFLTLLLLFKTNINRVKKGRWYKWKGSRQRATQTKSGEHWRDGNLRQDPPKDIGISVINCFPFVVGASFMLFMMIFSHINNVFRYLFPSYTLFILGASQIMQISNIKKQRSKIYSKNQILTIAIICYLLLTSSFSFPYDLSYTNELTGIPPKGYKYLSDSEIDWGQDLERLGNWLEDNNLEKETITLSYLGTADPGYYGIRYKNLRFEDLKSLSGILAISAGNLTLGDWQWRSKFEYKQGFFKAPLDKLRNRIPDAVIGKSIFVYRF